MKDANISLRKFIRTQIENLYEGSVKKTDRVDIYRDSNYIVIRPLTYRASCKYGAFTRWCISVPHAEYVWDSSPDAVVIFIIQKNYKISPEREKKISRFLYLRDKSENEEMSRQEKKELEILMRNPHELEDLTKIALTTTKRFNNVEIWDNNNIELSDNYNGFWDLPISGDVVDAIMNYMETVK